MTFSHCGQNFTNFIRPFNPDNMSDECQHPHSLGPHCVGHHTLEVSNEPFEPFSAVVPGRHGQEEKYEENDSVIEDDAVLYVGLDHCYVPDIGAVREKASVQGFSFMSVPLVCKVIAFSLKLR